MTPIIPAIKEARAGKTNTGSKISPSEGVSSARLTTETHGEKSQQPENVLPPRPPTEPNNSRNPLAASLSQIAESLGSIQRSVDAATQANTPPAITVNFEELFLAARSLDLAIERLDTELEPVRLELDAFLERFNRLTSIDHKKLRQSLDPSAPEGINLNPVVLLDSLHDAFAQMLAPIGSLMDGLQVYKAVRTEALGRIDPKNLERLGDEHALSEGFQVLSSLLENSQAYLASASEVASSISGLPQFSEYVHDTMLKYHSDIASAYGSLTGVATPSEDATSAVAESHYESVEPRATPVHRDNLLLTAYLHELTRQIPDPVAGSNNSWKATPVARYAQSLLHLEAFSDPAVYAIVQKNQLFATVAETLNCFISLCISTHDALLSSLSLHDSMSQSSDTESPSAYSAFTQEIFSALSGVASPKEALESFISDSKLFSARSLITSTIWELDSIGYGSQGEVGPSLDHITSTQRASYTDLFACVEQIVEAFINKQVSLQTAREFLSHSAPLIASSRLLKMPYSAPISFKGGEKSHFIVKHYPSGEILAEQIHRDPISLDTLVGDSWKEAVEHVNRLLALSQKPHLSSAISTLGTTNISLLVLSPDEFQSTRFTSAIMSDSRLLTVSIPADLLAQSDPSLIKGILASVRKLRERLGKPAVISIHNLELCFSPNYSTPGSDDFKSVLRSVIAENRDLVFVALAGDVRSIPLDLVEAFGRTITTAALTSEDQKELMLQLLSCLPLSSDFESQVNWDNFFEVVSQTSGDVVAKIAHVVSEAFVDNIKMADHLNAGRLDKLFEAAKLKPLTPALKLAIYQQVAPQQQVYAADFQNACKRIASDLSPSVTSARHRVFREDVQELDRFLAGDSWDVDD
jgi:hypothetical protein